MTDVAAVDRFHTVDTETGPGARLRARRVALGLKATKLARLAEVSREHLSMVENGHKVPTDEWVRRVELAMDDYQRETDQTEPEVVVALSVASAPELVRLTFHDIHGDTFSVGELIAEGPVDRPDELVAAVAKLFREMRGQD